MTRDDIAQVLDALPMPAMLVGAQERIVAANFQAHELFGRGLEGRHYITALRQPALLDAVEGAIRSGDPRNALFLAVGGSRDTTWAARAAPVLSGVLITLQDRTEVEEAAQMRRDFVANVSHELRTPLTALLGFIETLGGAARDDAVARDRFLGIMEREAKRMNRLVHDLLSLSRVEALERVRPTGAVDLPEMLRHLVANLSATATQAGRVLELEVGAGTEGKKVRGDADQLAQVFTNLIENGVKYGRGKVTIRCDYEQTSVMLHGPALRVEIEDDGDGFDPVHIPRLTERFYRVDTHRSREIGGTGLGLAIVKHIVGRHRGRLRVHSEPGRGSRFTVYLSMAQDADDFPPALS